MISGFKDRLAFEFASNWEAGGAWKESEEGNKNIQKHPWKRTAGTTEKLGCF